MCQCMVPQTTTDFPLSLHLSRKHFKRRRTQGDSLLSGPMAHNLRFSGRFWLGILSEDHVKAAMKGSYAEVAYGSRGLLSNLAPGDGLVYYSSKVVRYPASCEDRRNNLLRCFTGIGIITVGNVYSVPAPDGHSQSFRRPMQFFSAPVSPPMAPIASYLSFVKKPASWGVYLRAPLIGLSSTDFAIIAERMEAVGPGGVCLSSILKHQPWIMVL